MSAELPAHAVESVPHYRELQDALDSKCWPDAKWDANSHQVQIDLLQLNDRPEPPYSGWFENASTINLVDKKIHNMFCDFSGEALDFFRKQLRDDKLNYDVGLARAAVRHIVEAQALLYQAIRRPHKRVPKLPIYAAPVPTDVRANAVPTGTIHTTFNSDGTASTRVFEAGPSTTDGTQPKAE